MRRFTGYLLSSRFILRSVAVLIAALMIGTWTLRAIPAQGEEPPAGYSSVTLLKAAYLTGQLKLVDRECPVPDSIQVDRGIEYGKGGDVSLKLDLYSPKDLKQPAPALIFIHGGGWKGGKREDYHYYGVRFAQKGYVVATITYRLRDTAVYPAAVEDARCAVRWVRSNAERYQVDSNRIAVAGGSAGGHLSMMVGFASDAKDLEGSGGHSGVSSRVQAVVNLYGPVDLTTEYARSHDLVTNFIGKSFEDAADVYRHASPLTYVTADDPPTLTFHGTLDELVPVTQADLLHEKLKAEGVVSQYERLEGWPHAMDAAQVVNDYCFEKMLAFFKTHLTAKEL